MKCMKTIKILFRILVTPFVACIILISHLWYAIHRIYLFIRYGGEFIGYEPNDKVTIKDLYIQLQKNNNENK